MPHVRGGMNRNKGSGWEAVESLASRWTTMSKGRRNGPSTHRWLFLLWDSGRPTFIVKDRSRILTVGADPPTTFASPRFAEGQLLGSESEHASRSFRLFDFPRNQGSALYGTRRNQAPRTWLNELFGADPAKALFGQPHLKELVVSRLANCRLTLCDNRW
jgi:hypothetical protein